jgi:ADP-ribosylglycohydrolase
MYGAILGDIIGSPFEFDRGDKTKNFDLFSKGCDFTDDSVMTIAVGEALLAVGPEATVKEIEEAVVTNMQDWGKRYPYAGYGGRFRYWLRERNPKPYGSYGNGSAMRVSAAGWLYDSMERTREVARATANVTHNHPEGIKGAEATAGAIYMARSGSSKEEIKEYIEREFHYNLDRTLDEIRPGYHMDETCQRTVPEAIIAFLESKDFEDAIRNAVSLGGDTDTLGAITGSIAEAFYGIPAVLLAECRNRIAEGLMTDVLDEFDHVLGRDRNVESDDKEDNRTINQKNK